MSSRATEAALDALHAQVAEVLTEGLKLEDPSPQFIAQAIKFLALNGVNTPATSKRMTDLAEALKDLDLDEVSTAYPN